MRFCKRQQFSSLLKPTVEMKMERWNENKALENATKRMLSIQTTRLFDEGSLDTREQHGNVPVYSL